MNLRILAVTATCLSACATPFPGYSAASDAATLPAFPPQPPGTRAVLRSILTIRGMELPMTLRVWRKWPGSLRLIAADDLGGTLFHVVVVDGATTVIARSPALDEGILRDGLVADLCLCLLGFDNDQVRGVTTDGDLPGFLWEQGDRRALFWSSRPGGTVDRVVHGAGGALAATIRITWRDAAPVDLTIDNLRFGYRLESETRSWQPAPMTPATFRTDR